MKVKKKKKKVERWPEILAMVVVSRLFASGFSSRTICVLNEFGKTTYGRVVGTHARKSATIAIIIKLCNEENVCFWVFFKKGKERKQKEKQIAWVDLLPCGDSCWLCKISTYILRICSGVCTKAKSVASFRYGSNGSVAKPVQWPDSNLWHLDWTTSESQKRANWDTGRWCAW